MARGKRKRSAESCAVTVKEKRKRSEGRNAEEAIVTVEKERERRVGKTRRRPWTNLPEDILGLLGKELDSGDRVRMCTVCKGWQRAQMDEIEPNHALPWIMHYQFDFSKSVFTLYEPHRKSPHVVEDERRFTTRKRLMNAKACDSKSGWVLFSLAKELLNVCSYFVYNVMTKEMLTLPDLKGPQHQTVLTDIASFSSPPTSPDCVFFVPHQECGNQVFMSTYRIGDEAWKTHTFTADPQWFHSANAVTYMEGSFYCCSLLGVVSSFHVATQEWKQLSRGYMRVPHPRNARLLGFGGHLYLVSFVELHVRKPWCNVFRFDWSDGLWRNRKSLEGGVIFLGHFSFGVCAGVETKMVANRVYYFSDKRPEPNFISFRGVKCRKKVYYIPREIDDLKDVLRMWVPPPLFRALKGVGFR